MSINFTTNKTVDNVCFDAQIEFYIRAIPELNAWEGRAASLIILFGWFYFLNINFVRGGAATKLLFMGHLCFNCSTWVILIVECGYARFAAIVILVPSKQIQNRK